MSTTELQLPATTRKNALGYGLAAFHPDLSRPYRGHSLESSQSSSPRQWSQPQTHDHDDAFTPPPPLVLVAAVQPDEGYTSRRGPRVRFADTFERAVAMTSTPDISPVDQCLTAPVYLPRPQPVEVLSQVSREERRRQQPLRGAQKRLSPNRRSISSEANGVSSVTSSRTSSPFDGLDRPYGAATQRRDSPPSAPYCRTDGETVKVPAWGFRNCSTDSSVMDAQPPAANHIHDLHSTRVRGGAMPAKRSLLAEEPFKLQTELRGRQRSALSSASEASGSVATHQPKTRVASRSPIRTSPNKYATELRNSLSKSPVRVSFTGASASAVVLPRSALSSAAVAAIGGDVASSAFKSSRSPSAVTSTSGVTKPPAAARLQPAMRSVVPRGVHNVARPAALHSIHHSDPNIGNDEPVLCPSTVTRPTPHVGAPSMKDVMELYRHKLEALKLTHQRNMTKIQQKQQAKLQP